MHIRCPHCQNPIELVGDDLAQELTCPSCGSSFSLIDGQSTATYTQSAQKRLGHFELLEQIGVIELFGVRSGVVSQVLEVHIYGCQPNQNRPLEAIAEGVDALGGGAALALK